MNRIRIIFLSVIISVTLFPLYAQEGKSNGVKRNDCSCGFQSLVQGGLLEGATGLSWNIQTINGVRHKGWFAGAGLGLDHYMMRTIPVFIDVRKELLNRNRTPFLYADAGIHFDWLKTKQKPGWGSGDFDPGLYYDIGAGYKIGFGKRDALIISTGYTLKKLREERIVNFQCIQPPCDPSTEYYNYAFGRLTFKVGWQFR